jgi:hypothetical protein
MRDGEVYRALLGLTAPWTVAGADLEDQRVVVRVETGQGTYPCLFTHRDLWMWIDQPFEGPPTLLTASQWVLDLG